jgi:hypothetical protein
MAGTLAAVPGAQASGFAYWHPNGTQANVFYVGGAYPDFQIYNWYWTGSAWTNAPLGNGEATQGGGLSAVWNPDGVHVNVFYQGGNGGPMYNWWWTGSAWANSAL